MSPFPAFSAPGVVLDVNSKAVNHTLYHRVKYILLSIYIVIYFV